MTTGITGQGATAVLSTTGAVGRIQSIQLPEWAMERVDFTDLAMTNFMHFKPGGPTDPGEVVMTIYLDPTLVFPANGTEETLTVTLPKQVAAAASGAIIAGSGFIRAKQLPNLALRTAAAYELTISFSGGDTSPTFTPEPAPT